MKFSAKGIIRLISFTMAVIFLAASLPAPASAAEVSLTSEEIAYIKEHPKFTVAIDTSSIPYSYTNPSNGEIEGMLPSIINDVGKAVGLTVQYVTYSCYEKAQQAVKSGDVDIVAGVVHNPELASNLNIWLTDMVTTGPYCAVTKNGIKDIYENSPNYKVAAWDGSYAYSYFKDKMPDCQLMTYPSIKECIDAAENGYVDVAFVPAYPAEYFLNQPGYSDLVSVHLDDLSLPLCFGVSRNCDPILVELLNKGIRTLSQSDMDQAMVSNLLNALHVNSDLETIIYRNPMQTIVFVIGLLLFIMILLGFYFRNHKIVQDRHQRLAQELLLAEQASAAKRDFISQISHDIRTPLNAILGLTDFALKEEGNSHAMEEYLSKIRYASQYLLLLMNDVLEVSRIENNKMILHNEVISAKELFYCIDAIIRPLAEEKQIEYVVEDHGVIESYFYTDKLRIQQLILNLLINAVKYTPPGGKVECILINREKGNGKRRDRLIVRDNGIGISKAFLPKLFTPFEQERKTQELYQSGTGLGLSIVKLLVEMMNGTISVSSQKDVGTEFTIELETKLVDQSDLVKCEQVKEQTFALKGKRILLCEDNPINTEIMVKLLERKEVQVDHVDNGETAVEQFFSRPEFYYDAVLMDVHLPVMDGVTATKTIRGMSRTDGKAVPIIAISGDVMEDKEKECAKAGFTDCVPKPINPTLLYQTLQNYF
jgi:signal transduction histidine kinase/CheY-like chemotaxis protein